MSNTDMAKRIKDLRERHGLTLEEVANVVGVGKSTVRKWETGMIANMRRDKIASLAKALHTTPAYLMGWDENPELPEGAIPYTPVPMVSVPLVGSVNCGTPLFAEDNIEGYISTPETDIQTGETYFWLRAKGDSMINAGIFDGDLLLIRQQSDVDNGDIAVVAVNGDDATLKRIKKQENAIILQPENPNCETKIFIGEDMDKISIRGRLMKTEKRY